MNFMLILNLYYIFLRYTTDNFTLHYVLETD